MEHVWQTFDALFTKLHLQGRRVEDLESRVTELERRLRERETETTRPALKLAEPHPQTAAGRQ